MRSLLYRLGLGGKDHKQVRQLLLGRLDGNSRGKLRYNKVVGA